MTSINQTQANTNQPKENSNQIDQGKLYYNLTGGYTDEVIAERSLGVNGNDIRGRDTLDPTENKTPERILDIIARRHEATANGVNIFELGEGAPRTISESLKSIEKSLDTIAEKNNLDTKLDPKYDNPKTINDTIERLGVKERSIAEQLYGEKPVRSMQEYEARQKAKVDAVRKEAGPSSSRNHWELLRPGSGSQNGEAKGSTHGNGDSSGPSKTNDTYIKEQWNKALGYPDHNPNEA